MNFLSLLFGRSSKITYCGRAGLIYRTEKQNYFIDSEMLTGKPDIVLYWDRISYEGNRKVTLTHDLRERIVLEVKKELESEGLSVELHPFL